MFAQFVFFAVELEIEGFFTEEDKKKKELYREMENIYKIGGLKEY